MIFLIESFRLQDTHTVRLRDLHGDRREEEERLFIRSILWVL